MFKRKTFSKFGLLNQARNRRRKTLSEISRAQGYTKQEVEEAKFVYRQQSGPETIGHASARCCLEIARLRIKQHLKDFSRKPNSNV